MHIKPENYSYAPIEKRIGAYILDCIIVASPVSIILMLIKIPMPLFLMLADSIFSEKLLFVVIISMMIASPWQASVGGRMMNIFVVHNKTKITFPRAFARTILYFLICAAISVPAAIYVVYSENDFTSKQQPEYGEIEKQLFQKMPEAEDIMKKHNVTTVGQLAYPPDKEAKIAQMEVVNKSMGYKPSINGEIMKIIMEAEKPSASKSQIVNVAVGVLSVLIFIIWFGPIFITKEKTTLHDIICNTRVLLGKAEDYYTAKKEL